MKLTILLYCFSKKFMKQKYCNSTILFYFNISHSISWVKKSISINCRLIVIVHQKSLKERKQCLQFLFFFFCLEGYIFRGPQDSCEGEICTVQFASKKLNINPEQWRTQPKIINKFLCLNSIMQTVERNQSILAYEEMYR